MPVPVAIGAWGAGMWIVGLFGRLFATRIGQWIVAAMVFLGIEYATTTIVVAPLFDQMTAVVTASGLSPELMQWLKMTNIDRYVTIVISAYVAVASTRAFLRRRAPAASP